MIYLFLARLNLALHAGYATFVVLGGFLVLLWPQIMWLHIGALLWAMGTLLFDLGCPLTPLEKSLLRRAGREPYPEGFLQHHVFRREFSPETNRRNHAVAGIGVLLLNAVLYSALDLQGN